MCIRDRPDYGPFSLLSLQKSPDMVGDLPLFLNNVYHLPIITWSISIFACCALMSSLFGISVSLLDFLADKIKKQFNSVKRYHLAVIVLLPPLLFSEYCPDGFILALEYAGLIVAILNGVVPVLMYVKQQQHQGVKITFYNLVSMLLVLLMAVVIITSFLLRLMF